jgi:imidazolonepropionase
VAATRAAPAEALVEHCLAELAAAVRLGVTTVEAKSGYGLDLANELKILDAYAAASRAQPVRIVPTLLAAHAVPPEHRADRAAYVDAVCDEIIPACAGRALASFCDVFVEETAFSIQEARRILLAGRARGLMPKLHADQLADGAGAVLAAELGAVSADHLECVSDDGIRALASGGVVAVTLPAAALYLQSRPAPARRLIDAGVPVAVATDFNPGTAPSHHLPLALLLACTLQRLTPAEALKGGTVYAARALQLEATAGSLEPGKAADFAIVDAPDVNQWLYRFTPNACMATYIAGRCVWDASQ